MLPVLLAWNHWSDTRLMRHPVSPLLSLPVQPSGQTADRPEKGSAAWGLDPATAASHTSVLLSIEPAGTAVDADKETPVVFPGYLLPDDHHEEPVHEGS